MKRVGLIGCGAIGRPVARALLAGTAGAHSLAAVLARSARKLDGFEVTADVEAFLAGRYDLILETAGPAAFRALVPAALERCEVWAVSPIPLADPVLEREVRRIAATTGHALRIAPGALAAFDGIATAMAAASSAWTSSSISAPGKHPRPSSCSRAPRAPSGCAFPRVSTS
jgi:predicted dinucleotide-utilizing enzyme